MVSGARRATAHVTGETTRCSPTVEATPSDSRALVRRTDARLPDLGRKTALLSLGLLAELEAPAMALPDRLATLARELGSAGNGTWTTRRGPIRYLAGLRLWNVDLRNQRILDVGAGKSRFCQCVNGIYGSTGTLATPIDLSVRPKSRFGQRADARNLPFPNDSYDLVLNSWMLAYDFDGPGGQRVLDEMLRVAKPGATIRVGYFYQTDLTPTLERLAGHPEVAHARVLGHFGLTGTLDIALRPTPATREALASYYLARERAGNAFVPWRRELLDEDFRAQTAALASSAEAADRLTAIQYAHRLANAGHPIPFDAASVLTNWALENSATDGVRQSVLDYFLLHPEGDHFETVWQRFSQGAQAAAYDSWLARPLFRALVMHDDRISLAPEIPLTPATAEILNRMRDTVAAAQHPGTLALHAMLSQP